MTEKKIVNLPSKKVTIQPLTRKEIHEAAHERVSLITKEFTNGFSFLSRYPRSVTFFGSTRIPETDPLYIKARSLAERIHNELGYTIITGGGPGIMEAANRGAFESGGTSVGLTIDLPHEQIINPYINRHLDFYYFFSRKVCLSFAAEAYIFFPGGYGTLDEFFEIITLVQTKKIETVPMILVGTEFWNKYDSILRETVLKLGLIDPEDINLYTITDDEEEIMKIIKKAPVRNGVKFEHHLPKSDLSAKNLTPISVGEKALTREQVEIFMSEIANWHLHGIYLEKTFECKDFKNAVNFLDNIAKISDEEHHHPDIALTDYKHVTIRLTTHDVKGLSENDFIMASKIDSIYLPG